ncbi:MAG: hypothetical protein EOL87_07195 [Spartobacteria bacterium]|nr:hypothetical protein [Spartobacteria bacterium]
MTRYNPKILMVYTVGVMYDVRKARKMASQTWGIILACGKSEQLENGVDIAFLNLGGKPVLYHSIQAMQQCPEIDHIVVVAVKDRVVELQRVMQVFGFKKVRKIVAGTNQRNANIKVGMDELPDACNMIVLQDATRPLVAAHVISECVKSSKRYGCAIAAHKTEDVVKIVPKGLTVTGSSDKGTLWTSQATMACKRPLLEEVMKKGVVNGMQDEADAVMASGGDVRVVPSGMFNIRISTSDDIMLAEALLKMQQ